MYLKKMFFFAILTTACGTTLYAQESAPDNMDQSVVTTIASGDLKPTPALAGLYEFAGSLGGSFLGTFTPLTFYPVAYYLPLEGPPAVMIDDDPLSAISPMWPAYIVSPLGSALGVYYCGKYMGDKGSFIGSLAGAVAGEVLWWLACRKTRDVFPSSVAINQVAYHVRPVMVAAVALAGYKLVPPIEFRTKSLGFDLRPTTDGNGTGAEIIVRF